MDKEVLSDSSVRAAIAKAYVPVRIDAAQNQQPYSQYNVQYIPTLVILDSNGNEQTRCGYKSADELLSLLNQSAR